MEKCDIPYEKQIFVCMNDCAGEKPSCGDHQGEAIFRALRELAKERGLHPRIRVTQAKCLGQCRQGVNVMVYPDQIWFKDIRIDDVPRLADKYLSDKN